MNLKEYLFFKRITVKEFAVILDYSRTHISAIVNGKSYPGLKLIRRIERSTGGEVTEKDFIKSETIEYGSKENLPISVD